MEILLFLLFCTHLLYQADATMVPSPASGYFHAKLTSCVQSLQIRQATRGGWRKSSFPLPGKRISATGFAWLSFAY